MADFSQTIYSNVFSWIKSYDISVNFVPKGQINNIPALSPAWCEAIIWIDEGKITDAYASFGLNMF